MARCTHCQAETVPDEEGNCIHCGHHIGRRRGRKLGQKNPLKRRIEVPPVPPMPDTTGMRTFDAHMVIHRYFLNNAQAIMADYRAHGVTYTKKRWGFNNGTWTTFRRQHRASIVGSDDYRRGWRDGYRKGCLHTVRTVGECLKGIYVGQSDTETPSDRNLSRETVPAGG